MAFKQDVNSGALFKNDKEGNPKRPDYKGSLNVDGDEFWLSAWVKESKGGQKFMSLSVQAKRDQKPDQPDPRDAAREKADATPFDDRLPF